MNWQPIANAPQDKTIVDIWSKSYGRCVNMRRLCDENGKIYYEPYGYYGRILSFNDITHFMIVEPPKEI